MPRGDFASWFLDIFHYFPSDRTFARQNGTGHGTNCGKHRRRASCQTRNVEAIESPKRQRKRAAHHRLLNNEPISGNREAVFSLNRYQPMIRFFFFFYSPHTYMNLYVYIVVCIHKYSKTYRKLIWWIYCVLYRLLPFIQLHIFEDVI